MSNKGATAWKTHLGNLYEFFFCCEIVGHHRVPALHIYQAVKRLSPCMMRVISNEVSDCNVDTGK
jgi:hypothetical protein